MPVAVDWIFTNMEYEDAGGYEGEEEILSPEDIMLEYEDYDPEFYTGQPQHYAESKVFH